MKPEFSSSDLVLALSIVNGTAVTKARSAAADAGEARAGDAGDERQSDRGATGGRTIGHVR